MERLNRPWKYERIAEEILTILSEDKENDIYGRKQMYDALRLRNPEGKEGNLPILSECTVYRIMQQLGISHRPCKKPSGITKADRATRKSEDLIHRRFRANAPCKKCVTDITENPTKDGKLFAH